MAKIRKLASIENGLTEVIKILTEEEIEEASNPRTGPQDRQRPGRNPADRMHEGEEEEPGRETSPARRRAAGSRLLGVARVPIHQHNYGTRKTRDQKVRECAEVEQRSVSDQNERESAEAEQRSVRERRHAPEPRRYNPTCSHDERRTPNQRRWSDGDPERRLGDSK